MIVNIIGAGITGLAAAYYLSRQGHKVRIFESDSDVGGLSGYFPVEGTTVEKYYHHIFSGHNALIDLMSELGIKEELVFNKVKMGFYYEGRLYPFGNARDLLCFTPLKLKDRLRLGLSSLMMLRIKDWQSMEKRGALEWLQAHSGDAACRVIWAPLLKMKFGDNYDRISAAWLWNRVRDRRKSKNSPGGKEALGYIRTGYKAIFDALVREIRKHGGLIHTGLAAESICVENGSCTGITANGAVYGADRVLSTVPIPAFLQLAPSLTEEYAASLRSIKYQGSICVVLKMREALSDYYWINVSDPQSPFVGIIEHTNLMSPETYNRRHLVYLTRYLSSDDVIFSRPPALIYDDFMAHLKSIFPNMRAENVEQYWVFQDRFSQPVFVRNYSELMPRNSTPIRNLFLLNTTHLYPESRCLNSSISKAQRIVDDIVRNVRP